MIALRYEERATDGDWAEVLATFPLFSGVSKRRLRKLVRGAAFSEVARGQTVVSRGVKADALYIVLGGSATARRGNTSRELGVGDYFGKPALIDGALVSATVTATTDLHVMRLPAPSVRRLAEEHPAIMLKILRSLGTQLRIAEPKAAQ
jgi:CRP-like cAMP-binding protein